MHCQTLKLPISTSNGVSPRNPRSQLQLPLCSVFNCNAIQISFPIHRSNSPRFGFGSGGVAKRLGSLGLKDVDVSTLGNLCVDIVLNVPKLPPAKVEERRAYMDHLSASSPDKKYWEAGGNCNVAIAAARLGLRCTTIGHVGNETYGHFLLDVLHQEGISMVGMCEDHSIVDSSIASFETLLCWVLVDPLQRHGFCSRADFSKEPALNWMSELSGEVRMAIKQSKILFCNGYGFDDLTPGLIISALEYAADVGTSIFFDPGPRGKSLSTGTPEQKKALSMLLTMNDVLLLTADEAESLTGIGHPILAGQELLRKGLRTKWVIVKLGAKGSLLITKSSISCAPSFKVDVMDTVGCGDSFVAAIAFGYIHNLLTVNTLAIANAVGAATAMGCGAGRNVATLEKVIELLTVSNLNDVNVDKFWNDLLDANLDAREITLLSRVVINGGNKKLNRVSLEKVILQLLPKLQSATLRGEVVS